MDQHLQLSFADLDPELFIETAPVTEGVSWSAAEVCSLAGITYRQVDYWARTHLVEPSLQQAAGSGSKRRYSFRDVVTLRTVKKLLDTGLSLQNVRVVVAQLAALGSADLSASTLVHDGVSVYLVDTGDEVIDLLNGNQAVFTLTLAGLVADTKAQVLALPGEPVATVPATVPDARDELHARRVSKLRAVG